MNASKMVPYGQNYKLNRKRKKNKIYYRIPRDQEKNK